MARCDTCGRPYPDNYTKYNVNSIWGTRHYCCRDCQERGEDRNDEDEENMGFFDRVWRTIKLILKIIFALIVVWVIYIMHTEDSEKSESSQKTEQVSKKQTTTTTKTTSSSSKTTAGSKSVSNKSATQSTANNSKTTSNQKSTTSTPTTPSGSNSSSVAPKNAAATTTNASAKSTTSEVDISGEIYKALTDILESKGKSLKLNEAEGSNRGYESNIIVQMNQLRGTKYYNNALKEIMRCCPKYASEYSKNGKYFASEAEFYQSYISTNYSKILKTKKKETR